jgi:hypothetical protein
MPPDANVTVRNGTRKPVISKSATMQLSTLFIFETYMGTRPRVPHLLSDAQQKPKFAPKHIVTENTICEMKDDVRTTSRVVECMLAPFLQV